MSQRSQGSRRTRSRDPSPRKSAYLQLCSELTYRYSVLNYLSFFVEKTSQPGIPLYPVRAAVLEFRTNEVVRIDFDDSDGADAYSKLSRYLTTHHRCQYRLFLVEDLSAQFIELLGSHLNIDGTIFAHQIRDAHYSGGPYNGHTPQLPSGVDAEKGFTLRYYEARYFDDPDLPAFSSALQTLGNVPRQVTFGKPSWNERKNQEGHVGHVRRNTSFWSQKTDDGGWNAVILLDPPIPQDQPNFTFPESRSRPEYINNIPYQRGYRDVTPWPTTPVTSTSQWAPNRFSLLDDISYYWTTTASPTAISSAIATPLAAAEFQLKITAAIWMNTLEHLHAILSELETVLWEIERMIAPHLSDLEKERYMARFTSALNEVNTLRRRVSWYVSEMENNLVSLGVDVSDPPSGVAQKPHEKNFLAVYRKLVTYQSWAEKLMGVITSHVNLMETEKSISDSKSLSRLTVLGFFFVPISFVATFFSMGGEFGVGQRQFWIFWCVAVPLTMAALAVGFGKLWARKWEDWRERRWIEREKSREQQS